jgi:5-methylcytosine-specific restriction endonuclease McrA
LPYTDDELSYIYDKNDGYCWHCGKKLAFTNYGLIGARGAWEVDHSVSKAQGGTDYLQNLVPACISCNRSKGALRTRQFSY